MKIFISHLLIFFYLVIGFIGNFGAIDRVASQYVYLNIINILALLYLLKTKKNYFHVLKKSKHLIIFSIFIIWAIFSLIYSINKTETIISLVRIITNLLSFSILICLISELKTLKYVFLLILLPIITLEIIIPFKVFLEIYSENNTFNFSYSNLLETFTPNKNITAAIIACHIPFLLIVNYYNRFLSKISPFLIILGVINLYLLSSRATLLGLVLSISFITIVYFIKKIKNYKQLIFFSSYIFLALLISSITIKTNDTISLKNRFSKINTEDQSTNERLRYYSHGLLHISKNPLIGVGLGNWKLKSIEYDKENIKSYIVPYHAHNDFIQYGTELGIIGLILYGSIFLIVLIDNLKKINTNIIFSTAIIISLSILFVDSNINFPHHRPIMMILFGFIMALTQYNSENELH